MSRREPLPEAVPSRREVAAAAAATEETVPECLYCRRCKTVVESRWSRVVVVGCVKNAYGRQTLSRSLALDRSVFWEFCMVDENDVYSKIQDWNPPAKTGKTLWRAIKKQFEIHTGHLELGGAIAAGVDLSSQLMAYKNPGGIMNATNTTTTTTTVTGDYIDLNELLNLEGGGHDEDNSILI